MSSAWLIDMDGVLLHEGTALDGAHEFLANQTDNRRAFVVGEAGLTTALYEEGL